jgi:hypothetical protein
VIQFRPDFRDISTALAAATIGVLALFVALLAAMLVYLWLSIRPHAFELATNERDLLRFAVEGVAAERPDGGSLTAAQASRIRDAVRDRMMTQWAAGATLNRRANQRREDHRARASRFLLLSIGAILVLIGLDVIQNSNWITGVSGHGNGHDIPGNAGGG